MSRGCAISLFIATSLFGAFLALLALGFIVVNETQVDLAKIASESPIVQPENPSAPRGELVSLTGIILAQEPLGDDMFLAPGDYLQVERVVEMYASEEYRAGEDSNGKPLYKYRYVWTRSPQRGNSSMPFKGANVTVAAARIAAVAIAPQLAELPSSQELSLRKELLLPSVTERLQNGMLYIGKGSLVRPWPGDVRVSYRVVPNLQHVTVFAALDGDRMVPYNAADGHEIYKVMEGDRETALRDLGAIQIISVWIVRVVATGALWFGLLLLFYATRRLFAWPAWLGISVGSMRLATVLGLSTAALSVASLWLSQGNMAWLAIALGGEVAVACVCVMLARTRLPLAGQPSM